MNDLPQEDTTIHWHGMLVDTAQDGQPHDAVAPGAQRTYTLPVDQRASFNWYHPHPHMLVSPQVAMGLAGGFLITDSEEEALQLPSGAHEVPLVIRDAQIDPSGQLEYKPSSNGYLGKVPLVNGTKDPTLAVLRSCRRSCSDPPSGSTSSSTRAGGRWGTASCCAASMRAGTSSSCV